MNYKNSCHIEGLVYDLGSGNNKLDLRTTGPNSKNPGTPYIGGNLLVATDNELMNVVTVHFSYVTAVTSNGKTNETFNALQSIIDGTTGTVMRDGKEKAGKIRIDSAIGLNEFYDNHSPDKSLVSLIRNEGGFVHLSAFDTVNPKATFEADMLITGTRRIDADEERNTPEKMMLDGYVFSYKKELLPVQFTVLDPRAMNYFEGLGASPSNITFTQVRGIQISQTIEREIREESAFGDPAVKTVKSSQRDFVVNWARPETYAFDDESTILASELSDMMAKREIHIAEIKKNREEYEAKKNVGAFSTTDNETYNF